jgi:predicted HTH transcriptional regulator
VRNESFDEMAMPDLHSKDIDFQAASEAFSGIRKLRPKDLQSLHLLTRYQGREVPTVGGILLFGKDRERHFQDAWIQAGLFEGKDRNKIMDTTELLRISKKEFRNSATASLAGCLRNLS